MKVRNSHPHGAQRIPVLGIEEWPAGEIRDIPVEHARSLVDGGDYEAAEPWPVDAQADEFDKKLAEAKAEAAPTEEG